MSRTELVIQISKWRRHRQAGRHRGPFDQRLVHADFQLELFAGARGLCEGGPWAIKMVTPYAISLSICRCGGRVSCPPWAQLTGGLVNSIHFVAHITLRAR